MEVAAENEFDLPDEPSVTSDDPNERKLARRLRIQRRLEVLMKHDGVGERRTVSEKSRTEKQIESSAEVLEKLIDEGNEIVRNVRVANDARAVDRREEDLVVRRRFLEKLRDEAEECADEYRAIDSEWPGLLACNDPLGIRAGIESQDGKCRDILKRKDLLIEELRGELDNADEKSVADRKKRSEDIDLLIERIENQVSAIGKAYRKELVLIEEALSAERTSLLESVAKRWDALYIKRREEEARGAAIRRDAMKEYEEEMRQVMIEHREKYRSEKIELEIECQNLELEVQRVKALCAMNIEKLDYGYAVLKRREDENTIVKNQQRRRINKLQDTVSELKKNYSDLELTSSTEMERLREQVKRARNGISQLEAKSRHFERVNEKQYFDIWDMNVSKANELLDKIFSADRIIHEQMLGVDWEPPSSLPLPSRQDLSSYLLERETAPGIAGKQRNEAVDASPSHAGERSAWDPESADTVRRLLKRILEKIADHTGFLLEDKLRELLASHSRTENIIIRLDNVFQALGITSADQIDLLLDFFLPYAYCPICEKQDEVQEEEEEDADDDRVVFIPNESHKGEFSSEATPEREATPVVPTPSELDATAGYGETSDRGAPDAAKIHTDATAASRNAKCARGHLLEIRSIHVTRALREFAEKNARADATGGSAKRDASSRDARKLTDREVTSFWNAYRDAFPAKRERLWDGLYVGLGKYHEILRERHRLNEETTSLGRQNDELRRLLETYAIKPVSGTSTSPGPRITSGTP